MSEKNKDAIHQAEERIYHVRSLMLNNSHALGITQRGSIEAALAVTAVSALPADATNQQIALALWGARSEACTRCIVDLQIEQGRLAERERAEIETLNALVQHEREGAKP
jgi:hypothetical protein